MYKRNILESLTQKNLDELHPNSANPLATAPSITTENLQIKLRSLGLAAATDLPDEFDWRKQPGVILTKPMNQGGCGNCWAVSSTQTFADRWMISTGKTGLVLDPLPTTVCTYNQGNGGCAGGLPENCQTYFESIGASVINDNCTTWDEYCEETDSCCKSCPPTSSPSISCEQLGCNGVFKAVKGRMLSGTVTTNNKVNNLKTIQSIKADIKLHGPVVAKFAVFGDFYAGDSGLVVGGGKSFKWDNTNNIYINGSYEDDLSESFKQLAYSTNNGDTIKLNILAKGLMPHATSSGEIVGAPAYKTLKGYHAVEIVGWGNDKLDNDKLDSSKKKSKTFGEYWIVKNSWGDKWNGDGYFKFGINLDGKTNNKCGMDIPITTDNGSLFGGTVSFIPTADPKIKWDGMKDAKKDTDDSKDIKGWECKDKKCSLVTNNKFTYNTIQDCEKVCSLGGVDGGGGGGGGGGVDGGGGGGGGSEGGGGGSNISNSSGKSGKKWWIFIFVLISLLILIYALYLFLKKNKKF